MGNSFLTGNPMQKNPDGSFSVIVSGVGDPPLVVAAYDATALAANVAQTNVIYTVPAGRAGMYRIESYVVLTQAATTSSTLPALDIKYTDESGFQQNNQVTGTDTANILSTSSMNAANTAQAMFYATAGSQIIAYTSGYTSVGATPMQYAVHVRLVYLG